MLKRDELDYMTQEMMVIAAAMQTAGAFVGNRATSRAEGVLTNGGKLKNRLSEWHECETELQANPPEEAKGEAEKEEDEDETEGEKGGFTVDETVLKQRNEHLKQLAARCTFMESALVDLQSEIDRQIEEVQSDWKPPIGHWSQRPKLYKGMIDPINKEDPRLGDWLEALTQEYFKIKHGADDERIEKKLRHWCQECVSDPSDKPLSALFAEGAERIERFVETLDNPDLGRLKIYHWATEIMFLYNSMVASTIDEHLNIIRDSGPVR
jgi:hypothetical protein